MLRSATPISAYLNYNKLNYEQKPVAAIPLNLSQIYKPTLNENQQYKYLKEKLDSYSRKTAKMPKIDDYQVRTYQKLFQLLYDLTSIDNQEILCNQLHQIRGWLEEQERMIKNRVKQGLERFNVTKESRRAMSLIDKIQTGRQSPEKKLVIPSDIIEETLMPYIRKWRTYHEDSQLPAARLHHYETKHIEIESTNSKSLTKEEKKYSMLNKNTSYLLNSELDALKGTHDDKEKEGDTTQYDQNASIVETGFLQQAPFIEEIILPDQLQLFGGEDADEEESRQENEDNDLVPTTKLYMSQTKKPTKSKKLLDKRSIVEYEDQRQVISQNRLQLKFDRNRKSEVARIKEDSQIVDYMERRAKNKSSLVKEDQKKLELKTSIPVFSLLKEETIEDYKLSEHLEKRYGLNPIQTTRARNEVDLGFSLPKLNTARNSVNFERSTQKPSLNILKKRFSDVLQLSPQNQHQPREQSAPKSLVQYTSQKKIFPWEIDESSKKTYRQQQLNQIETLRQKLNVNKLNLNIQTLINGLCVPQQNPIDLTEIPQKKLMKNQFITDGKKSKKKKK